MATITDLMARMRENPGSVRFVDLCKVCEHFFGQARQTSGSHRVYKTPWIGDPRVNIQNSRGNAKAYQVKAIERLETEHGRES